MRKPIRYVELDVLDDSFWWLNIIDGVSFNGVEYSLPPIQTMTDTGTPCNYIPSEYYEPIMEQVTIDIDLTHDGPQKYANCRDVYKLPVIEVHFGGFWLELSP